MHECPYCGKTLTAPPSHCYEGRKPLTSTIRGGISGLTILLFAGVALATLLILGMTLIG